MPVPDDGEAFLRAHPVFAGLPGRELTALVRAARDVSYRARDYVFMEDEPAEGYWIVKQGHVKIVRHARMGRDVVLELLGPGEAFGGVAVLDRRPYPASAQTTEASVMTRIARDVIVPLAERYPSMVREMALMIGRRLRTAHDSVTSLAADPVEARLAATLVRIATREGQAAGSRVTLPFHLTRQSLADMTGTTVETAIRIMSRWQRGGLVLDEHGHLVLSDVAALREIAAAVDAS